MDKKEPSTLTELDNDVKKAVLKKAIAKFFEEQFDEVEEEVTPERLKKTYELFIRKHKFKVGDIVKWKPGLKDRKLPRKNDPAIVIEVLDKPIIDHTENVGSAYFNEQYDIKLGVIHPDGTFLTFYYDSRRFEPYIEK